MSLEHVPCERLGISSHPVVTQMTRSSRHFPSPCLCSMPMDNVRMSDSASQLGRWEQFQPFVPHSGLNKDIQDIGQGFWIRPLSPHELTVCHLRIQTACGVPDKIHLPQLQILRVKPWSVIVIQHYSLSQPITVFQSSAVSNWQRKWVRGGGW